MAAEQNANTELMAADETYNEQLERYSKGVMKSNEFFTLGMPLGILSKFMPLNKIILRQKVVTKAQRSMA